MAKGYCTHCKSKNDLDRLFNIIPIDDYCLCPNCDHKILIKDAKHAYLNKVKQLIKKAYFSLSFKCNYLEAYQRFGYILNFDSENAIGICGRMEALLMLSTLRESQFKTVNDLLKIELNVSLRKKKNFMAFYSFTINVISIIEKYMTSIKKMLTHKAYFYDEECLLLYLTRAKEVVELYNTIYEGILEFKDDEKLTPFINKAIGSLDVVLRIRNNDLLYPYIVLDGYSYKLKKDKFELKSDGFKINLKLNNPKIHALKKDENKKLIKDKVFKYHNLKYVGFLAMYASIVLFYLLGFILYILCFIYSDLAVDLSITATVFVFIATFLLGLRFLIKDQFLKNFKEYSSLSLDNQ